MVSNVLITKNTYVSVVIIPIIIIIIIIITIAVSTPIHIARVFCQHCRIQPTSYKWVYCSCQWPTSTEYEYELTMVST